MTNLVNTSNDIIEPVAYSVQVAVSKCVSHLLKLQHMMYFQHQQRGIGLNDESHCVTCCGLGVIVVHNVLFYYPFYHDH